MKDYMFLENRYKEYEDRILVNGIIDYIKACESGSSFRNTDFLDPRQQKIVKDIVALHKDLCFGFFGGIEESERAVCIIYNESYELKQENIPITIISIRWSKSVRKLTHRDFLGSILGCGIKREKVGDIILDEDRAYVACMSDISRYLFYNLNKVGSTAVSVSEENAPPKKKEEIKIIKSTVASLRLDSLISAGYGVSRGKAVEIIKSGKVKINWQDTVSSSKEMKQGDVISFRGKGRIVLDEVSGATKKNRIGIIIKKYL